MPGETPEGLPVAHCFIDEVGDTTFYGKGKELILGQEGVSLVFGMGIVKFGRPLAEVRAEIIALHQQVESDPLLNTIPSVARRVAKGGFFFHASKDSDDVRTVFLHYLRDLFCEAEIVIARKVPSRFIHKHHGKDDEFYADVLSHLIKNRIDNPHRLVLNIAERGSSTRSKVLEDARSKAAGRRGRQWGAEDLKNVAVFNVQTPLREPLLTVPDYFGWAVQRVFEKGQTRFYDYLREKIRLVVDLYDSEKAASKRNHYDQHNPLTAQNKIDPSST